MDSAESDVIVSVKHGKETFSVQAKAAWKVQDLMEAIQAVTNVHPRGEKLICKGKHPPRFLPARVS